MTKIEEEVKRPDIGGQSSKMPTKGGRGNSGVRVDNNLTMYSSVVNRK